MLLSRGWIPSFGEVEAPVGLDDTHGLSTAVLEFSPKIKKGCLYLTAFSKDEGSSRSLFVCLCTENIIWNFQPSLSLWFRSEQNPPLCRNVQMWLFGLGCSYYGSRCKNMDVGGIWGGNEEGQLGNKLFSAGEENSLPQLELSLSCERKLWGTHEPTWTMYGSFIDGGWFPFLNKVTWRWLIIRLSQCSAFQGKCMPLCWRGGPDQCGFHPAHRTTENSLLLKEY